MSEPALRPIAPMKAVIGELPPDDGRWATELKWDGMRLLVLVGAESFVFRSASGRDATRSFPELHPLTDLVPPGTVLDGEAVVMSPDGPSFRALQHRIHVDRPSPDLLRTHPVSMLVFDLLWFDGHEIMSLPFESRRSALEEVLETGPSWSLSTVSDGSPVDVFAVAEQRRLEGVVCKRFDGRYVPGARSPLWRKIKIRPRTDMVIGGWIPGSGGLSNTIGSVVVGVAEDDHFRCAGSVGSGLTAEDRRLLAELLVPRSDPPFVDAASVLARPDAPITWVEPTVVAEIGFARWTKGEPLWQPTFHGIRFDADASQTQYRQ